MKIVGRVKNIFNSISNQMVVLLICILLPLNIISVRASTQYATALEEQARQNINSISGVYLGELSAKAQYATTYIGQQLAKNPSFITIQKQAGDDAYILARNVISKEFYDTSQREYAGDVFYFYSPKQDEVLLSQRENFIADRDIFTTYIQTNVQDTYGRTWVLAEIEEKQYILRSFYVYDMYFGVLINLDTIVFDIQETLGYDNATVEFLANSAVPLSSTSLLVVEHTADNLDFVMRVSVPWADVQQGLTFFQRIQNGFTLVYLALIPILIMLLRHMLVKPLLSVSNALRRFREGDSGFRLQKNFHASEFTSIQHSFNDMADNIVELKIDNYEHRMARQEIELQNLQLTIRPHFLQNTFGLLYTLSQTGEAEKTGEFVLYLSNYFRSIHQGMEYLIPVSQEINLIRSYIEIATLQYPGNIAVTYEIDDDTLSTSVPSLLLHNFIENSITHGLIKGQLLTIRIQAHTECDGRVVFKIQDDGLGMEDTIIRQINAGMVVDIGGRIHVGLYNSYHRLKMIYGDEAFLHIDSAPNEGTLVTVEIPAENKKENN